MQAGDAKHGVMDCVAFGAADAQDLPGLHPGEDVLDAGADLLALAVVLGLPLGQLAAARSAVWNHQPGARVAPVGDRGRFTDRGFGPDSVQALQSFRLPATGLPIATTRRVRASMTTWWLVEYR